MELILFFKFVENIQNICLKGSSRLSCWALILPKGCKNMEIVIK